MPNTTIALLGLLAATGVAAAGYLFGASRLHVARQLFIIGAFILSWWFALAIWSRRIDLHLNVAWLEVALQFSAVAALILLPIFIFAWFVAWAVRGMRGSGNGEPGCGK